MPENKVPENHREKDDGGRHQGGSLAIQPREIKEYSFRALCAAGADPYEAQEGALAILRAEEVEHLGLRLGHQLLEPGWTRQEAPTVTTHKVAGGNIHQLSCTGAPALRAMIQLMDLACDDPGMGLTVAFTVQHCPPGPLWDDLLIRQTARLQRRIAVATSEPGLSGTAEHGKLSRRTTGEDGITVTDGLPAGVAAYLPAGLIPPGGAAVVVLPESAHVEPALSSLPLEPLKVCELEWQQTYQSARKFLAADA